VKAEVGSAEAPEVVKVLESLPGVRGVTVESSRSLEDLFRELTTGAGS
jgi:hypothetical protein